MLYSITTHGVFQHHQHGRKLRIRVICINKNYRVLVLKVARVEKKNNGFTTKTFSVLVCTVSLR